MTTIITIGGRAGATFSGMQDCVLHSGFPNTNYPAETDTGGPNQFLLRPDLTGIPPGATIVDAYWTINAISGAAGAANFDMRRLLRLWIEAQATFNEFATGSAWGTAGALQNGTDRSATDSCTIAYTGGFATGDMVSTGNTVLKADIQSYVNGSLSELSWFFLPPTSCALPAFATAAQRPLLTVEYDVAAAAPSYGVDGGDLYM